MFSIARNGVISMNRGDTFTTPLYINIGTTLQPVLYQLEVGDILYFGVMEPNKTFEESIIRKRFTQEDYNIEKRCVQLHFTAKDTEFLTPGVYYYSAKLLRNQYITENGIVVSREELVDTVIPKTKLYIME